MRPILPLYLEKYNRPYIGKRVDISRKPPFGPPYFTRKFEIVYIRTRARACKHEYVSAHVCVCISRSNRANSQPISLIRHRRCTTGHSQLKTPRSFSLGLDTRGVNMGNACLAAAAATRDRHVPGVLGKGALVCTGRFGSVTACIASRGKKRGGGGLRIPGLCVRSYAAADYTWRSIK